MAQYIIDKLLDFKGLHKVTCVKDVRTYEMMGVHNMLGKKKIVKPHIWLRYFIKARA